MTTRRVLPPSLSLVLLLGSFAGSACKKDEDVTTDPETATTDTTEPADEGPTYPPQDPDPAEIAQALERYILGHYEEAANLVRPLSENLLEDSQIRARGLASAVLAMAVAHELAENGKAPAQIAQEQADRLADPELTQMAGLAKVSYLVGLQDYAEAETILDEVGKLETPYAHLVTLFRAEATLGQAFEDDKLKYPEKLDAAAAHYQSVWDNAAMPGYKGRAAEGLTAVGYYKKDKDQTCQWSNQALDTYEAAGASDYMLEGPRGPADAMRCERKKDGGE